MLFSPGEIYSFAVVVFMMIISPGPNTILIMQSAGFLGLKAALYNTLGIVTALLIQASLAGLGLSIILMQLPQIYNLIKLLGALYIIYLGLASWYSAWRLHHTSGNDKGGSELAATVTTESASTSYTKGFITNILNVQTAFIFLALFPQFMHQQNTLAESFFLTLVYILLQISWYCVIITLAHTLRHWLLRTKVQKWVNTVTGTLLVALGVRIAVK